MQIEQLLLNLLRNALEALTDTPSDIRQVTIRATPEGTEALEVTVEDNGPGIPSENIPQIFNPFFTTNEEGLGLGLTICRSIVEAHGGRIAIENGQEADNSLIS